MKWICQTDLKIHALTFFTCVFPRVCVYFHLAWTARKLKLRDRTLIKKANMKLLLFSC